MILLSSVVLVFCLLRLGVALYNTYSRPILRAASLEHHSMVSILIPARNESANIFPLLQSLSKLDYQNFEVIVLDDHSTDDTYVICEQYCLLDDRFQIIKGTPLPPGWLGKNYACHQLAEHAKGDFLLFVDADTLVSPSLLNAVVDKMQSGKLDLLSVFPDQEMNTTGEKTVVPLMHYLLLSLLPLELIFKHPDPVFSAASGQLMCFQRDSYRQHQWHMSVRNCIAEDLKIMKLLKQKGLTGQGLLAGGLISCRMYRGYQEAINGFSKNFMAPFDNKIWLFLLFISFSIVGPLIVFSTLNPILITLMVCMILLTRSLVSVISRQRPLINILLHPLQLITLGAIAYYAIYGSLRGTLVWKDRPLNVIMKI